MSNWRECLKIIHTIRLCVALSNQSGFLSIHRTIQVIFQDIDPATTNNHCSFGRRDQILSFSRNQCIHLLIYSLLLGWHQYCLIRPRNRNRRQRQVKLEKKGIKAIIENEIRNRMINTGVVYLCEGNMNIKIRERCYWQRKRTFHWRGVSQN